jgi:integrase
MQALPPTADLATLGERTREYLEAARSANTRRAYRNDWARFAAWCAGHGLPSLPAAPTTVALYLTEGVVSLSISTLGRHLVSIAQAHRAAGLATPTTDAIVASVWRGIRRTHGTAQVGKSALLTDDLRGLVARLPEGAAGTRDRAMLLLGFAGAFRRSELVGLDVADLELRSEGLVVTLRRSKTDQEGAGQTVGIPFGRNPETCPVLAVRAWLELVGTVGPLFVSVDRFGRVAPTRLSDRDVARIVKRAAEAAGLDPSRFAGHSLRSGLATSAAAAGVEERQIMAQTRHRSVVVVRRYIHDGSLFRANAAAAVGL